MKMDAALLSDLNDQLNYERFSAEKYCSIAVQLDSINLSGLAAFMHKREGEERSHAHKFMEYMTDRGASPILTMIPDPEVNLRNLTVFTIGIEAFRTALEHEKSVTARINALYDAAEQSDDGQTCVFLHWFLSEQTEEERSLDLIITKFILADGNGAAILMLDKELGS